MRAILDKVDSASTLKLLAGDSAVYGLLFALSRCIGIITFPIISRIFVPADYGALDLIGVTSSFASSLMGLGISNAVFRYFYDYDSKRQSVLVSTSLLYQVSVTVIFVSMLLATVTKQLSTWLLKDPDHVLPIQLALIAIPLVIIDGFVIDLFRLHRKKWHYLIFSLTGSVMTVLATVFFVVKLRMGIAGALLGGLLTHLSLGCLKIYFFRHLLKPLFDVSILKKLLRFSIPLVPLPLIRWVVTSSNRYIMRYFTSLNQIGLFSVAFRLSVFVNIFLYMIQYAWSPIAYSIYRKPETPKVFARILTAVTILSTFLAMVSTIFAREILALLAPAAYHSAYRAVGPIAFGMTSYTIFYMILIAVLVGNETKHATLAYLVAASASLVLNIVLIPLYGMLGAAFALFFSYVAAVIYIYFRAQSVYRVPYEVAKLIKTLLIGGALSCISMFWPIPIFMRIALTALYPVILYIFRIISTSDIAAATQAAVGGWRVLMRRNG